MRTSAAYSAEPRRVSPVIQRQAPIRAAAHGLLHMYTQPGDAVQPHLYPFHLGDPRVVQTSRALLAPASKEQEPGTTASACSVKQATFGMYHPVYLCCRMDRLRSLWVRSARVSPAFHPTKTSSSFHFGTTVPLSPSFVGDHLTLVSRHRF